MFLVFRLAQDDSESKPTYDTGVGLFLAQLEFVSTFSTLLISRRGIQHRSWSEVAKSNVKPE